MRWGFASFAILISLATAASAVYFATPPLYTDGSAVTCAVVNLHSNGEPIRMWIEVGGYPDHASLLKDVVCPAHPITTTSAGADPAEPGDASSYPPNSCFFWCGNLDKGQSCTTPPIYPPAGHTVTCVVTAPGTGYDGNDIQTTLFVGAVLTTVRGEG